MKTDEIIKKYAKDKEHLVCVSKISLIMFEKLKHIFPALLKYDNKEDLNLLEIGARLHDIGIFFEKIYNKEHNKAGAKFIIENPPEDINEKDLLFVAGLIRYHRKNLPKEKHKIYSKLTKDDKIKLKYLGAILKLSDGLDFGHLGITPDIDLYYSKKLNTLTLKKTGNIMLNAPVLEVINKKKDFFEDSFKVKFEIES